MVPKPVAWVAAASCQPVARHVSVLHQATRIRRVSQYIYKPFAVMSVPQVALWGAQSPCFSRYSAPFCFVAECAFKFEPPKPHSSLSPSHARKFDDPVLCTSTTLGLHDTDKMLWYIGLILLQAASCSSEPVLNNQGHHRHRHTARDSSPKYTSPDPAGLLSTTAPSAQPLETVLPAHITTRSQSTKSSSLDTSLPTSTIPVITRLVEAGIEQIALNPTPGPPLGASGTIITTLNTTGQATQPRLLPPVLTTEPAMVFSFLNKSSKQPVNRIASGPQQPESGTPESQPDLGSLSIDSESQYEDAVSELGVSPVTLLTAERVASTNVFAQPISGGAAPPAFFKRRQDHPVPRTGIASPTPLATNKFYSNLYLGSLRSPVYLHPYALHWVKGQGVSKSWGMSISHVEASQRVFGPKEPTTGASRFFINPIHIESLILSATDLGATTALTVAQMTAFSAMAELRPNSRALPSVRIPLVQGSAFVTGVYQGSIPVIGTGVHFKAITRALKAPKPGVVKFKIVLENGATWLLYARNIGGVPLDLQIRNSKTAVSTSAFHGTIQIAKEPGNGEAIYDQACGAYATSTELSGTVKGTVGSYTLTFKKQGLTSSPLLMFALPHMVASFNSGTAKGVTQLRLQTTTKGIATGVLGDSWTMEEKSLPTNMGFLPWLPGKGTLTISSKAKAAILPIARSEIAQDMSAQSNLDSMYFSGKVRPLTPPLPVWLSNASEEMSITWLTHFFALTGTRQICHDIGRCQ